MSQKLTDTMMLVSIDPLSQTIGVMSLRRDLW
jgi:anionic cell wall polymer biosynthesis LytR-Cps2A-Psr (LCP) family protein